MTSSVHTVPSVPNTCCSRRSLWALSERCRALACGLLALAAIGCKSVDQDGGASTLISQNTLQAVGRHAIYFGHQSVGYNILDGVDGLLKELPGAGITIVETKSPDQIRKGIFAHSTNGKNLEPLEKTADFSRTMDSGVAAVADVAFFKLCYVDVTPATDVDQVFSNYQSTMKRLKETYPKTRFVHVTVPLTVVQGGAKAAIKKLLGRGLGGADANVARHRFNEKMRHEYEGREPFFDLAEVEATRSDGTVVDFEQGGQRYPALAPEYASDGSHLNAAGSRWVAQHLLKTLSEL